MVIIPVKETMGLQFVAGTWLSLWCCQRFKIQGLTRIHIMPYWWTTAHWQAQFAMDVYCPTDISLNTAKSLTNTDERWRYCSLWMSAKKKGRPKVNVCEKSVVDFIKELVKKKQTRRMKIYCRICHKFHHNTADCFQNPTNPEYIGRETDGLGEDGEKAKAWGYKICIGAHFWVLWVWYFYGIFLLSMRF